MRSNQTAVGPPSASATWPPRGAALVALVAVGSAALAAHVVTVLLLPDDFVHRNGLTHVTFNLPFAITAAALALRSRAGRGWGWGWQALAIMSFLAANVYAALFIDGYSSYPSWADAMWLAFYPLTFVSVIVGALGRRAVTAPLELMDGLIAGLGAAALTAEFALSSSLHLTGGRFAVVATNVAYPAADLTLVVLLVACGYVTRSSDRAWKLRLIGLLVFFAGDLGFLFEVSTGSVNEAAPIQVTWPIGVLILGAAALSGERGPGGRSTESLRLGVPAGFTAAAIGLLAWGRWHDLSPVSVVFAVLTLCLGLVRLVAANRQVAALAASRIEARTDVTTGLPNRRCIAESIDLAMASSDTRGALVLVDIDDFREVNDALGHEVGDELLRQVGQRLGANLPPGTEVGRLGGDEFAVLVRDASAGEARDIATSLRSSLDEPFEMNDLQLTLQASAGIAVFTEHGRSSSELLARADIAMYQAKRERTGVSLYRYDDDSPSRGRLQLLSELRRAFDVGEFISVYQPQMDLATRRVIGLEALVRWNHPRLGMLAPARFLQLVSHSGSMGRLTGLMLGRALGDLASLGAAGNGMSVSVNVAASDVSNDVLARTVSEEVVRHGLSYDRLVIEVTEDSVITDPRRSFVILQTMRDLGVRVSVDDFGVGHASLSYLRDLPLDEIKLDRSFLSGVPGDRRNEAMVLASIELAHALGLPLLAEGIESEETALRLQSLGCDLGQGYFFGRPMILADIVGLLARAEPTPSAGGSFLGASWPYAHGNG